MELLPPATIRQHGEFLVVAAMDYTTNVHVRGVTLLGVCDRVGAPT